MKNALLLSIVLSIGFNYFGQLPNYVPSNGLIGWYPFTGNTNDLSVNAYNGVNNGASLTTDRTNTINQAYQFNGNENIDIPFIFNYNERSISVWFSIDEYNGQLQEIIANDNPALTFGSSDISVRSDDYLTSQMGLANTVFDIMPLGLWTNVTITRNLTTTKFYLNGSLVSSSANDNTHSLSGLSNFLKIGCTRDNDRFFNGKIDDLGLWNRALSQCEIQDLYNAQLNSIQSTVSITGITLNADLNGATYQWLDCDNGNSPIVGETNQSFTPIETVGNYSVQTTLNGCVDTSTCYLLDYSGIEINVLNEQKKIVKITDLLGREIPKSKNTPMLFIYEDGSVLKVVELDF